MIAGRARKSLFPAGLSFVLFFLLLVGGLAHPVAGALRVPAFTAYIDPDVRGARVSERSGITRWTDPAMKVLWFGQIKTPGRLDCSLALKLPEGAISKLRLTVAGRSREFLDGRTYRAIMWILGALLTVFAVVLLWDGIQRFW